MKKLSKDLFNNYFSHIYIEKEALNHPNTKKILSRMKNSKIIEIDHYKDIFSRSHQNFYVQKQSPSLILAYKKNNLIYNGARFCDDFGNDYFYYTSSIMNCIYNCEYCYLQGMYSSANIVIFVNIEDIFTEVTNLLKKHPVYLCISYDTDLLAFENILGYASQWIEFASLNPDLKIELRTKSANFNLIRNISPSKNVILAWTLSPQKIIQRHENRTPCLKDRLNSIKQAMDNGWNIRLCFDPILYSPDWKTLYTELINTVFSTIQCDKILDISIGVFRVSSDYLKIMRKQRFDSVILNYPFALENKAYSYEKTLSEEMISYVKSIISRYVSPHKIYI